MVLLAVTAGELSAWVAVALIKLIGLFTNLFFFQRVSTTLTSPAGNHLGLVELAVPVGGALLVGLMARFGSEKIRGHGIPEALEAILMRGSRVEPKVTLLKPLSAAISIGSGGPFGAEGPIIMTGGSLGSTIGQLFKLSAVERKILLVAGAAGGMSATFAAPVAAVLLALELLLFEWRPRSLIPVALASAVADAQRQWLLGTGPLFPVHHIPSLLSVGVLAGCGVVGILAAGLAIVMTRALYAVEDGFERLPIHWMWWPAIGALAIGIGGLYVPQALGVGYDVIGRLLGGSIMGRAALAILVVKASIWVISLGSGTSGGVFAPLLMMGAALGALEASFLPVVSPGFWALVSMAAVLGGTLRVPLTAIVFALELTHEPAALLPLLLAVVTAQGLTVFALGRSLLTEKISRRGYLLTTEYAVDLLETRPVSEVMRTDPLVLPAEGTLGSALALLHGDLGQHLFPVLDDDERLVGIVTRRDLLQVQGKAPDTSVSALIRRDPIVAYPDEALGEAVRRMTRTGCTRLPVVEAAHPEHLVGLLSVTDVQKARAKELEAETRREQTLRISLLPSRSMKHPAPPPREPGPPDGA